MAIATQARVIFIFAFRALGQQDAAVGVDQHHRRDEDERRASPKLLARLAPSHFFLHLRRPHPNPPPLAGEG